MRQFAVLIKIGCSLGLAVFLTACGAAQAPTNTQAASATPANAASMAVTVPFTAYSAAFTSIWVAADEDFFAKHGIQANVQYMDATAAAAALLSNEIPFSTTPAIGGTILAGGDVNLVAKLVSRPSFSLYAVAQIKRVENLKGKIIADTQAVTASDSALRDLLSKHGMRDTEVQFVYTPNPTAALAALMAGQTFAAIVSAPVTLPAKNAGYTEIADTVTDGIYAVAASISTKKARIKNDPASIRAFLSALRDATEFMKSNPARTKAIIGKCTRTDAQADLDETYTVFEPTWMVGAVQPADVAAALRYSNDPRAATADPAGFFDNSFVEALPVERNTEV